MAEDQKIKRVLDPESRLEVRWTDNGVKSNDPDQIFPDLNKPLVLDENGIPLEVQ